MAIAGDRRELMRTSRDLARLFGELGPRKVDQYSAEDAA